MLIKLFIFSCCFMSINTSNPNVNDINETKTSSTINATLEEIPKDVTYYYNVNEIFYLKCNNTDHCGPNSMTYYWFLEKLMNGTGSRAEIYTECLCPLEDCTSGKKVITLSKDKNNTRIYCCGMDPCRLPYQKNVYRLLLTTEPTAYGQIIQKRVLNEKNNNKEIIVAILSGVLILFAIAMLLLYFKKWKPCDKYGKKNNNGHNGGVEVETYASSQNLTYAQLQLKSTNRQLAIDEATPYAKIIGVLEPSKDD